MNNEKYIKIIYNKETHEAFKIEFPRFIDKEPILKKEARQHLQDFIESLEGLVFPSEMRKDDKNWFVTLNKREFE